jgi:CheY-like chemotaxis protein
MAKRILILDDRVDVRDAMKKYIKGCNHRHEVSVCSDCSSVIQELDKQRKSSLPPFDLFICDLNMHTIGLANEQASKTQNGLRTGWVLLTDILIPRDLNALEKIVFFSGWVRQLKDYIQSAQSTAIEKEYFFTLNKEGRFLSKADSYDQLRQFID